jgi:hypothetical protein
MTDGTVYVTDFYPLDAARCAATPQHGQSFDLFLVSSSAESGILDEPAARAAIDAARPQSSTCDASFVSIGCLGLFAAILEFERSGARRARLLLLESPAAFVQETLDIAGLGVGGDGFVAQEVSYVVEMGRQPQAGALRVAFCQVLAREPTLGGTAKFASRIHRSLMWLTQRYPDSALVTFDNGSKWARRLAQMLAAVAGDQLPPPAAWLPTVEVNLRHFMTARPVLDLLTHLSRARSGPFVLTCLGAGGRFGLLAMCPDAGPSEICRWRELPLAMGAISLRRDGPAMSGPRAQILYTRKEYFGRGDFYFKWALDLSRM